MSVQKSSTRIVFAAVALVVSVTGYPQATVTSTIYQNLSAPTDQKNTQVTVGSNGWFYVCPMTDAGVSNCSTDQLSIGRLGGKFSGFTYLDSGLGVRLDLAGNDVTWHGAPDSQPVMQVFDTGTTGALAGFLAHAGSTAPLSPTQVEGMFYCSGPQQNVLAAPLIGGPATGGYCVLSVGDQLFAGGIVGSYPLSIGVQGTEKIRVTPNTVTFDVVAKLPVTTVAALPACNAGLKGSFAAVSDATAPAYNTALSGGGAVSIPAYCNGTGWVAH
jgi:hypothetical protein